MPALTASPGVLVPLKLITAPDTNLGARTALEVLVMLCPSSALAESEGVLCRRRDVDGAVAELRAAIEDRERHLDQLRTAYAVPER
jgi:hypothetical protein